MTHTDPGLNPEAPPEANDELLPLAAATEDALVSAGCVLVRRRRMRQDPVNGNSFTFTDAQGHKAERALP